MRSDKWDDDEKKPCDGMMARKKGDCKHYFENGKCLNCGKTREQLRGEW